jgi:nucleoside-diphosphate-sugar epimerase
VNDSTVLGARGFIGSHLVAALRRRGRRVATPSRDADLTAEDLGTVYYCIGVTADFRSRPFDTVETHVCKLGQVLRHARFSVLVYLSSTRIYGTCGGASEEQSLRFDPVNGSDLYNLSKVMGESLALHCGRSVRVARLANVYGEDWHSDNFLPSVIKAALRNGDVTLQTAPESAKDYVYIDDVVDLLARIGEEGRERIYNVASGRSVTNAEVASDLRKLTRCSVTTVAGAPAVVFPPIQIERVRSEFGFAPSSLLEHLPRLVEAYRLNREAWQ